MAHEWKHVTFFCLSGTNMYSVLPLLFTRMVPKPGTDLVEITTDLLVFSRLAVAPDANGTVTREQGRRRYSEDRREQCLDPHELQIPPGQSPDLPATRRNLKTVFAR